MITRAVLGALHLRQPDFEPLRKMNDAQWRAALEFCDRERLTLAFARRAFELMPGWVQQRVNRNRTRNTVRLERLLETYRMLLAALGGIEFLFLKGVVHTALSGEQPQDRIQYDIDLYAPRENALAARELLIRSGYESLTALEKFPTDHLPALIRKTGWEWRGDFFDPDIPVTIELHHRFWDEETERIVAPGLEQFWSGRVKASCAGLELPVLRGADALGYAALHVLRHLLRGSLNIYSVYELAAMLDRLSNEADFWRGWRDRHPCQLRRLEALSFQLARRWFAPKLAFLAEDAVEGLPHAAKSWFDHFGFSPLDSFAHPSKPEVWLHLALLGSWANRWCVARRRLLPLRMPGPVDAVYVPESGISWRRSLLRRLRYGVHVIARVWRHVSALPRTLRAGAWWWLQHRQRNQSRRAFVPASAPG